MRYEQIIAKDRQDAFIKAKQLYGGNASVLRYEDNYKEPGFLNMFKKKVVRATISIPDNIEKVKDDFMRLSQQQKILATKTIKQNTNDIDSTTLITTLKDFSSKIDKLDKALLSRDNDSQKDNLHPNIAEIKEILKENEFYDDFINELIKKMSDTLPLTTLDDRDKVHEFTAEYIRDNLMLSNGLKAASQGKKKIISLVGPTGVGKTTTIAKIAANARCNNMPVAMITTDGYRMGAREQLKKFAEILQVPMQAVERNVELQQVLALSKEDFILIDTTGQSQSDNLSIAEMRNILDSNIFNIEYILAISATTKTKEVRKIFKSFDIFDYNSVIITKLDESDSIGAILSEAIRQRKSIMFYTNGQSVPNNIEKADFINIISKIKGLNTSLVLCRCVDKRRKND